jgi:hypothetical protein
MRFLVPKEYCSLKQVTLDILTYFLYVNLHQTSIQHLCNQHTIASVTAVAVFFLGVSWMMICFCVVGFVAG